MTKQSETSLLIPKGAGSNMYAARILADKNKHLGWTILDLDYFAEKGWTKKQLRELAASGNLLRASFVDPSDPAIS